MKPCRIELFDDQVDSIRTFDIGTQRSIEIVESAFIPPVKKYLFRKYREDIINNNGKGFKKSNQKLR